MIVLYIGAFALVVSIYNSKSTIYDSNIRDFVLFFFVLLFAFIFGYRDFSSGVDTQSYVFAYENIQYFQPKWDYFFLLYMELLSNFEFSSRAFIMLTSAVSLTFLSLAINNFNKDVRYYNVLIFFLMISSLSVLDMLTNGLRQGLAVCISFYGISWFINKGRVSGILIVLCSALVHSSVFAILIIMVASANIGKIEKSTRIANCFVVSLFFISVVFNIDLSEQIFNFIASTSIGNSFIIFNRFMHYASYESGLFSHMNMLGKIAQLSPLFIPLLIHFVLGKKSNESFNYRVIYLIYCSVLIIYLMLLFQPASYRYTYLIAPILPILFVWNISLNDTVKVSKKSICIVTSFVAFIYALKYIWLDIIIDKFTY